MRAKALRPRACHSYSRRGCSSEVTPRYIPAGSLEVGVPYRYNLYTHCGLLPFELRGSVWTVLGETSDGNGNPPTGFGNLFDKGTLWLIDADHARFRSSQGVERNLIRGGQLPSLGCA
jgi:hypothetical protein